MTLGYARAGVAKILGDLRHRHPSFRHPNRRRVPKHVRRHVFKSGEAVASPFEIGIYAFDARASKFNHVPSPGDRASQNDI